MRPARPALGQRPPELRSAREYLEERGITPEVLVERRLEKAESSAGFRLSLAGWAGIGLGAVAALVWWRRRR